MVDGNEGQRERERGTTRKGKEKNKKKKERVLLPCPISCRDKCGGRCRSYFPRVVPFLFCAPLVPRLKSGR